MDRLRSEIVGVSPSELEEGRGSGKGGECFVVVLHRFIE
jgi:hypothetical protein